MGTFIVRLEAEPRTTGAAPLDNLFVDNRAAVQAAINFLIAKGHRRIGMLAGSSGPASARASGFRQALIEHDIALDPVLVCITDFSEEGGYRAMQQLLHVTQLPSAVFAENDVMALGALMAIKDAGLSIPADIALIGFDDIPGARLVTPALTTVTQFQSNLGRRAAEMLFERINGLAPAGGRSTEMPFDIVVRESA